MELEVCNAGKAIAGAQFYIGSRTHRIAILASTICKKFDLGVEITYLQPLLFKSKNRSEMKNLVRILEDGSAR